MTKSRFAFFIVSSLLVLPILAGSLLGASSDDTSAGDDSLYKYLSVFTETLGLVDQAYVEETEADSLMAAALDGVTDALDPLAVYVPEAAVTGYMEARAVGPAHSGLFLLRERGMIYVLSVQPGSPADRAGVRQGDLIAEIDGESTRVMPLWEIQEVLAGEPGTEVDLQVVRFAENLEKSFTLGAFEPAEPSLTEREGVAVLAVPSFEPRTAGRVEELLARVESDRLLVDLRGASGGDAATAYQVAGLFVPGELGRLEGREGPLETYVGQDPRWSGRIGVITDRSTLGAAEIVASVLQQKADAELIGSRTFGFAGRQTAVELSSGALLFLADAFYTGPDHEKLDEPLEPDVRVVERPTGLAEKMRDEDGEEPEDAEEPDTVLERAVEHLNQPAEEPAAEDEVAA